jgi:uncharacterized protein with NRDE domain
VCTLLLWKRTHPRYPLIAAANRDEFLDRPATKPLVLSSDPLVVGGRDETAGGTWFAVAAAGLVVALTNRRGAGAHDSTRRSRGALVLDIARSASFSQAYASASRIDPHAYNPFVLFVADSSDAIAVHSGSDGIRVAHIGDGAHAITNWDLDVLSPRKAARALHIAAESVPRADDDADALARRLHVTLGDHGGLGDDEVALCVHRSSTAYGSRSSSIAFLGASSSETRLYHAEGPPCRAPLEDVSALLRHETGARRSNDVVR